MNSMKRIYAYAKNDPIHVSVKCNNKQIWVFAFVIDATRGFATYVMETCEH